MNSIVQENNQATGDIFTFHILPWFDVYNIQEISQINQIMEEYSYEARTNNLKDSISSKNYIKIHSHVEGIFIWLNDSLRQSDGWRIVERISGESLTHLKYLRIENLRSLDVGPDFFSHLENLIKFYVSHCEGITEDDIKHLKNLVEFEINDSFISGRMTHETYENLKVLKISHRGRRGIYEIEVLENLTELELKDESYFHNDEFIALRNLKSLTLHSCSDINNKNFDCFKNLTSLKLIDCPNITSKHFETFKNLTSIIYLGCPHLSLKHFKNFKNLNTMIIQEYKNFRVNNVVRIEKNLEKCQAFLRSL